jgi:Ca2+-binding RTX toxin-like protein
MPTYFGTARGDIANIADELAFGLGGNDLLVGNFSNQEFDGGDGNDLLITTLSGGLTGSGTAADPYTNFIFTPSGNDTFFGGTGSDALFGGDGEDQLYGGDGNDTGAVVIESPNDPGILLYTTAGLRGGAGNDRLFGEAGNDELFGEDDNDFLDGGTGNDILNGGSGVDRIYGQTGNDALAGEAGTDKLYGGSGADVLSGGIDADRLYGEAGVDYLAGDAGADLLAGGTDKDTLRGGADADTFRFYGSTDCGDRIRDFELIDTLSLKKSAFGNLAAGVLSSAAYRENTTGIAGDTSDRFIYDTDDGKLYYDSNGSAAGGTKFLVVTLDNEINISRFDIELY